MDPKYFDYYFLDTSDERGLGIRTMGIKEGAGGGERVSNVTRAIT